MTRTAPALRRPRPGRGGHTLPGGGRPQSPGQVRRQPIHFLKHIFREPLRDEGVMQLGTIYPQTHIEVDPGAVRSYGTAVEELGFGHILAFDHVVGANVASRPGWDKPYD